MEDDESPRLTGVVVITLPPSGNLSLGKTITAYTLSETPQQLTPVPQPESTHSQPHQPQEDRGWIFPSILPITRNPHRHFKKLLFWSPRIVLGFLGICLLALLMRTMASTSFSALLEFPDSRDDDGKPDSFIFPLYPKLGVRGASQKDVELKLGRFVEKDGVMKIKLKPQKGTTLESSTSPAMDSSTFFPVRGNVYPNGLYFTSVLIGNPPRPYFLDVDTGSDLTWVQCDAPCASCAKGPHPFYKPTKGKVVPSEDAMCTEVQKDQKNHCGTCHQCDYEIEYADRSSSMGVLSRDEVHLMIANGSVIRQNVVFGCGYDQQGLLLKSLVNTDGILGLSKAKVSLPYQLAHQGIINNVVGHCLAIDARSGGYMFLGDEFVPYWGMAWVPMLNSPSINFYHTEIVRLGYGRAELSLGALDAKSARVVFDTGSSYTYFTQKAYSELVASLQGISGEGLILDKSDPALPICWRAKLPIRSVEEIKQFFKPLTLQLGSQWWPVSRKFQIPPEGYLIISNKGNVCLGILDGSNVHDGSTVIIGDISLRGKLVVYDNVNQKIGWARSDCLRPQKFKSSFF